MHACVRVDDQHRVENDLSTFRVDRYFAEKRVIDFLYIMIMSLTIIIIQVKFKFKVISKYKNRNKTFKYTKINIKNNMV